MNYAEKSLELHYSWKGKLDITPKMEVNDREMLSMAYTPGVAQPCIEINRDVDKSFELTWRQNTVAVVTDGTAVLGLGDIGPEAGMPVMEGKCVLFKAFAGVNAVPLCLRTRDVDEIVNTIVLLAGSFGGINLEDISAPRCFEIEEKLKQRCDIPVFHDDQHGTAIVVLAALKNALKVVNKRLRDITVVISGAGAAGTAIARLLCALDTGDVIVCDSNGALRAGDERLNPAKKALAAITNKQRKKGSLAETMNDADVFIGVSAPGIVSAEMVEKMAENAVIFALSNPVPEIMPEEAYRGGAAVVGTGRSDMPNQINNVLAFPGIFRGALDVRASDINDEMKLAAAETIAELVGDELNKYKILPEAFDARVGTAVAAAVAKAAVKSGAARIKER